MKTEKVKRGFIDELRSSGLYIAAVGFFASGYLCCMYGSSDGRYLAQLVAWYRTPITLAVVGLPMLLIANSVLSQIIKLRELRIEKIENAEKDISHQMSWVELEKVKINQTKMNFNELRLNYEQRQHQIIEKQRQLKVAENHLRKSITDYHHWAHRLSKKISKTSTTLIGDAGSQAPEQIAQLQKSSQEILRLLDKKPESLEEDNGEKNENA
jgi:hypothetical protein